MPFIIYIPDSNEIDIEFIYDKNYYELIQSLKNGTINFINQYYNLFIHFLNIKISKNFFLQSKLMYKKIKDRIIKRKKMIPMEIL